VIFLDSFDEIYSSIIAGAVPSADGAHAPLMLILSDLISTDEIHLFTRFDDQFKRIYYFAAPSRVMHSQGQINLPLVAAVPGMVGHRGNGAYLLIQGPNAAAAIFNDGDLRFFSNSVDAVEEAIRETGLPIYNVSDQEGEAFESMRGKYRRQGERMTAKALYVYAFVAMVTGVGYVGMSAATGYFERTRTDDLEERQRSVEKLANSINFVSPIHERLARLQSISEVVVRSGGWIDSYEFSQGRERFKLMLPEWVTHDHYAKLGGDVTAELEGDGMVAVVKLARGEGGKPIPPRPAPEKKPAEGEAAATSATQAGQPNAAKGSLLPQAPQGQPPGAQGGPAAEPAAAAKEPKMPAQAPFGSAASKPPPSSAGHAH
jgi:hypothetical protein